MRSTAGARQLTGGSTRASISTSTNTNGKPKQTVRFEGAAEASQAEGDKKDIDDVASIASSTSAASLNKKVLPPGEDYSKYPPLKWTFVEGNVHHTLYTIHDAQCIWSCCVWHRPHAVLCLAPTACSTMFGTDCMQYCAGRDRTRAFVAHSVSHCPTAFPCVCVCVCVFTFRHPPPPTGLDSLIIIYAKNSVVVKEILPLPIDT